MAAVSAAVVSVAIRAGKHTLGAGSCVQDPALYYLRRPLMTDVRDPASLIEAAQKAVGAEDYLKAERLLREAAATQEAGLGPDHPDVAGTLNNLAFVCERLNKVEDAERGYRR